MSNVLFSHYLRCFACVSARVDSEGIDRRFHSSRSFLRSSAHSLSLSSRSSSQDIDKEEPRGYPRISKDVFFSGLKGDWCPNQKGNDPPSVVSSRGRCCPLDLRGRGTNGEDGPTPFLSFDRTAGNEAGRARATAPRFRHVIRRWSRARARRQVGSERTKGLVGHAKPRRVEPERPRRRLGNETKPTKERAKTTERRTTPKRNNGQVTRMRRRIVQANKERRTKKRNRWRKTGWMPMK